MQDPAISAMIGEGREGVDYWLDWTPLSENARYGDEGARVTLVFTEPVTFDGITLASGGPCKGHTGEDGVLKSPDDSCVNESREFTPIRITLGERRVIFAQVDVALEQVFNVYPEPGFDGDAAESIIDRLKAKTPRAMP